MQSKRTSASANAKRLKLDQGPYEAVIVSHMDPTHSGGLKVTLIKQRSAEAFPESETSSIEVSYLSPFYGVTSLDNASENDNYASTQKSYGMWMVPPDIGTKVLVIFAEGDISRGYWIGCIQDKNMNFMLPDGRASTELTTASTPGSLRNKKLPVGEYNKKVETGESRDPTRFKKPYNNDFVTSLQEQGLLEDETRGTTSTSARREVPSSVFGISTPGPLDKRPNAPKGKYGTKENQSQVFVNRLGGSSFVMDDGNEKFVRKTAAGEGPPEYASVLDGEKGEKTIPHNELTRLRTRTGHQILLHNSEDLIYISNAKGTTWIELTSNGKIDIFADDSISIHSKQDLNFKADRDINFQASNNINMKASKHLNLETESDYSLVVTGDYKITTKGNLEINTAGNNVLTAGGKTDIGAGTLFTASASVINLNSGPAATAATAETLTTHSVPGASASIMKRVPQHEPWSHHENLNPAFFTPGKTDASSSGAINDAALIKTPDTFRKGL